MAEKRETEDFYPEDRLEASQYAHAAGVHAAAAKKSAEAAADRATAAETAQGKAEAAATAAGNSATEASGSASSARNSATEAKRAAAAAGDSATAAADSAKDAGDSAVHAEDCERAAEAAQGKTEAAQRAAEAAAQNAASGVVELLQEKVDAAEAAKGAAETAQGAANASANAASSSATAAAKSAAASASSASAAKQSATDLAEAVATAESLDGRIVKIETGKNLGFLASGGFQAYTQLNAGDGSFKVLKDLPNIKKVALKAYDDSVGWGCFDDGNYAYVYSGQYKYDPHILFIFDSRLNAVAGPINNGFDSGGVTTGMVPSKVYYHAENERLYGVEGLYNSKLVFGCMSKDGALLKRVATSITSNGGNTNFTGCVVYNKRSGHIVVFYIFDHYDGNKTLWYQAFDLDLNPVLNEDGSERIYSRLNEIKETWHNVIFSVKYIEDVVFLLENGGYKANGRIFTLDENDDLCVLHEGLVQADEDGRMLCETREVTNEDGTTSVEYVLDAPERNKMVRPILADGGEYHFNVAINEEARPKMTAAGACRRNPVFCYYEGFYFMNDGVDVYVILKSGEIVDSATMPGNWTSGKHGAPGTKAIGDRSANFTKSSHTLYCISGGNVRSRFTPSLVYDTSTGNELSSWRRMTKNNFIWEVGNLIWPCILYASTKPEVYYQASPFRANWLFFGNLWYTNAEMIIDHKLTYI